MRKKYDDIMSGGFLLAFSVTLFIASLGVKRMTVSRIGSGFVPQLVAVFLAMVSIPIILDGIKSLKGYNDETENSGKENTRKYAVIGTLGLIAVYIALLNTVGFIIMTSIYLFIQINVLARKDDRKIPLIASISVVVSVAVYYLFVNVFNLMLPAGILG